MKDSQKSKFINREGKISKKKRRLLDKEKYELRRKDCQKKKNEDYYPRMKENKQKGRLLTGMEG